MDEISTGLDSSTTFSIINTLRQSAKIMDYTVLVSLLQPAPETFELFDDIILLSEGKVVYHGPRVHVLEFFESCGFKCPDRKGIADFLQEVGTNLPSSLESTHFLKPKHLMQKLCFRLGHLTCLAFQDFFSLCFGLFAQSLIIERDVIHR
jgi:ABC-type multidrug transport system ATPase subunit